jgi:hypothetical protein
MARPANRGVGVVTRFYPSLLLTCLLPRPKIFFPRASAPATRSATPYARVPIPRPPRHPLGHGSRHLYPDHEVGSQLAKSSRFRKRIPRPGSRNGPPTLSLSFRSPAQLPQTAGPPKFPNETPGKRVTAPASPMRTGVQCPQVLRPLEIYLHHRPLRQLPMPPSSLHSLCHSTPSTLARGCLEGLPLALQRPACCRPRTSAAEAFQHPRLHRLHWACWSSVHTRTLVALVLSQTMVVLWSTFNLATSASKLQMDWSTKRLTSGICQWWPRTLRAALAAWFSATCAWFLASTSRFCPCDSSGESSASTHASPTSMRWSYARPTATCAFPSPLPPRYP